VPSRKSDISVLLPRVVLLHGSGARQESSRRLLLLCRITVLLTPNSSLRVLYLVVALTHGLLQLFAHSIVCPTLNMARITRAAVLLFAAYAVAQTTTPAPSVTRSTEPSITAVSDCHPHGTVKYAYNIPSSGKSGLLLTNHSWCMVGTEEYQVVGPTRTQDMQAQYTGCHSHGTETWVYMTRVYVKLLTLC
jgi:hypothetical protein